MKKRAKVASKRRVANLDPRFAPVVEAFAADPGVKQGKVLSSFGLKVNGRIFAMMVRGKFVAKLPKARVDEIVTSGIGKNFEAGLGRVMKEWVAIESDELDWVGLAR